MRITRKTARAHSIHGTAASIPPTPKSVPSPKTPSITVTGCNPVELPITRGLSQLDSICCTNRTTPVAQIIPLMPFCAEKSKIGLTPMIVLRRMLLNGVFGLAFGWLYRKFGLRYAMIAHGGCHVVS